MKYIALTHTVIVSITLCLLMGCRTSASTIDSDQETTDSPTPVARVFVDGEDHGITPTTVSVRRSFGDSEIKLMVGETEVRAFLLELGPSSNRSSLAYSFKGKFDGIYWTYDLVELATLKDSTYLVPELGVPITIEDPAYDFTLLVQD